MWLKISRLLFAKNHSGGVSSPYRYFNKIVKTEPYGETPLVIWYFLYKKLSIQRGECLLELGAGRMQGVFYLSLIAGIRFIAIERNGHFIKQGQEATKCLDSIQKTKPTSDKYWCCEDLVIEERRVNLVLHEDLRSLQDKNLKVIKEKKPTWIYFYGVGLSEDVVEAAMSLATTVATEKTTLISVGIDLSQINDHWEKIEQVRVSFPWGRTFLYLLKIKSSFR